MPTRGFGLGDPSSYHQVRSASPSEACDVDEDEWGNDEIDEFVSNLGLDDDSGPVAGGEIEMGPLGVLTPIVGPVGGADDHPKLEPPAGAASDRQVAAETGVPISSSVPARLPGVAWVPRFTSSTHCSGSSSSTSSTPAVAIPAAVASTAAQIASNMALVASNIEVVVPDPRNGVIQVSGTVVTEGKYPIPKGDVASGRGTPDSKGLVLYDTADYHIVWESTDPCISLWVVPSEMYVVSRMDEVRFGWWMDGVLGRQDAKLPEPFLFHNISGKARRTLGYPGLRDFDYQEEAWECEEDDDLYTGEVSDLGWRHDLTEWADEHTPWEPVYVNRKWRKKSDQKGVEYKDARLPIEATYFPWGFSYTYDYYRKGWVYRSYSRHSWRLLHGIHDGIHDSASAVFMTHDVRHPDHKVVPVSTGGGLACMEFRITKNRGFGLGCDEDVSDAPEDRIPREPIDCCLIHRRTQTLYHLAVSIPLFHRICGSIADVSLSDGRLMERIRSIAFAAIGVNISITCLEQVRNNTCQLAYDWTRYLLKTSPLDFPVPREGPGLTVMDIDLVRSHYRVSRLLGRALR